MRKPSSSACSTTSASSPVRRAMRFRGRAARQLHLAAQSLDAAAASAVQQVHLHEYSRSQAGRTRTIPRNAAFRMDRGVRRQVRPGTPSTMNFRCRGWDFCRADGRAPVWPARRNRFPQTRDQDEPILFGTSALPRPFPPRRSRSISAGSSRSSAADGIAVKSLAASGDRSVHLSHYRHTQPNSFRFGGYVRAAVGEGTRRRPQGHRSRLGRQAGRHLRPAPRGRSKPLQI